MKAWLLLGCLSLVLSGCLIVPVPQYGKTLEGGTAIKHADWNFATHDKPSRSQVVAHFGPPSLDYPELNVMAYTWETLDWRVFAGAQGASGELGQIESLRICFVQFDDAGRLKRYRIMKHPNGIATRRLAEKWSAGK